MENEACVMGYCKESPGQVVLTQQPHDHGKRPEEVTCQQWISSDRTKFTTLLESKAEFTKNFHVR